MQKKKSLPQHSRRFPLTVTAVAVMTLLGGCAIMPQPFSQDEQRQIADQDRVEARRDVEPLSHPLTLSEAVARALKYNLDHRTRLMEQAVALGQFDLSRYDMLPKLLASAGYNTRDNENISRAKDSVTGLPSLANPYISSDRSHTTTDLGLTWNLLDFGISYLSAKQNADRVLIASERRRKAMHILVQDVRTAFWRAASAEKLEKEVQNTISLAESALVDSRRIETEQIRNPLEALRYQRTILENLRILESIRQELTTARIELAALTNLPPGSSFSIAEPTGDALKPPRINLPIEQMEEIAVANNADLREQFYNARIAVEETKKSLLRLFPSISFNYNLRHDTNSYLVNKNWQEAGALVSWNLFSLLSAPATMRYSEANEKLAEQRRIAVQMAVLAQAHLARQQYENAYSLFERADTIWQVDQRIYEHTANREAAATQSKLERISSNTSAIISLLRRYQALAQVYAANSKVQSTLGMEPAVSDLNTTSLDDLTKEIDKSLRDWEHLRQGSQARPQADANKAGAATMSSQEVPASTATPQELPAATAYISQRPGILAPMLPAQSATPAARTFKTAKEWQIDVNLAQSARLTALSYPTNTRIEFAK